MIMKERIETLLAIHDFGTDEYLCIADIAKRYNIPVTLINDVIKDRWDNLKKN